MLNIKQKNIENASWEELEQLCREAIEKIHQENFERDLPISYSSELLKLPPNQVIHEYKDGRKFLVEINSETGEQKIIGTL